MSKDKDIDQIIEEIRIVLEELEKSVYKKKRKKSKLVEDK